MKKLLIIAGIGIALSGCGIDAEMYYPQVRNVKDSDLYQTHLAGCKQSVLARHSYKLDVDIYKVRPRIDACLRDKGYILPYRERGVMIYGASKTSNSGENWMSFPNERVTCRMALERTYSTVRHANPQAKLKAVYYEESATIYDVGRERHQNASLHCIGF